MNYLQLYARFLKKFLKAKAPLRVVIDASNGAAGLVLRELKKLLPENFQFLLINDEPDGRFPAHGPDPTDPRAADDLKRAVLSKRADFGAVLDGDGDRVFFVDDKGRAVTPDATGILLARQFKGPVLLTPLSGYPLREYLAGEKRRVFECRVGHFFIKKAMRVRRLIFAAETSGHYYFKDFFYADSGILTAILAANQIARLKHKGIKLSAWLDSWPHYPRLPETNFRVRDKRGAMRKIEARFRRLARRISKIDGFRMEFGAGEKSWWFNVRPSNTEDLLRLNVEAKDKKILEEKTAELRALIRA